MKVLALPGGGEYTVQKVENAQFNRTPAFLCQRQRPFDVAAIVSAGALSRYIGPENRKGSDDLFERRKHAVQRKVPGAPIVDRHAVKFLGEHVDLAGKVDLHDAFFAGIEDVVEALGLVAQSAVNTSHRR